MSGVRTHRVAAMAAAAVLLSGAGFLPAIAAEAAPGAPASPVSAASAPASGAQAPSAAAWVVDAALLSGRHLVQLAEVSARSGAVPSASATPLTLDGQGPVNVQATKEHPQTSAAQVDWKDPTGSLTMQGGYGTANVEETSTAARAGIAAASGSSFAMAAKMLTWDQQQQLTGAVASLNDALVDPLNQTLQALAPVLSTLGLAVPLIQKMSPLAVINVGSGEVVTASASTAYSPGFSAAHAVATVSSIQLLDGFIEIDGLKVTAGSENASDTPTRTAEATLGQVRIAGLPVKVGEKGLEILTNNVLARTLLQPVLDQVLQILRTLGINLRIAETSAHGDAQEATALALDVPTPAGVLALSVGHAEAGAPPPPPVPSSGSSSPATGRPGTTAAALPAPVHTSLPAAVLPAGGDASPALPAVPAVEVPSTTAAAAAPDASGAGTPPDALAQRDVPSWLGVTLPAGAAKALGGVFLLLLLGGLGMALVPAMILAPVNRRPAGRPVARRPILDQEVTS